MRYDNLPSAIHTYLQRSQSEGVRTFAADLPSWFYRVTPKTELCPELLRENELTLHASEVLGLAKEADSKRGRNNSSFFLTEPIHVTASMPFFTNGKIFECLLPGASLQCGRFQFLLLATASSTAVRCFCFVSGFQTTAMPVPSRLSHASATACSFFQLEKDWLGAAATQFREQPGTPTALRKS